MPTKPLDRLTFAQGGLCFFCKKPLSPSEPSVEHLVATANGGNNHDDNCVVCCKALNALLGSMSLKEKIQVILNQRGEFKCPNPKGSHKPVKAPSASHTAVSHASKSVPEKLALIIADLHKRGTARPRTVKTLSSTISALFQKHLPDTEVSSLIEKLCAHGVVTVSGTKVSYELPSKVA
jgi:predicted RNA binding protein YcfA (HicA-like mRNA interferase family)